MDCLGPSSPLVGMRVVGDLMSLFMPLKERTL